MKKTPASEVRSGVRDPRQATKGTTLLLHLGAQHPDVLETLLRAAEKKRSPKKMR